MTGNSSLFIKSVTISGFKSFKETTTIDTLEPRHNVIVGRNGSGKSNLFSSIRFVLGDGFHSLSKEQRASLLNDDNVISAYCSITLDNSSQTIPSLSDSLVIKRSIGLKKDEYSIDGKPATRSDLSNLLTSAGFVESNPYYIVPQGRIQHLTNAKDHQRLKLLRDIAGTSVYEQKRLDSLKIIHETQAKKLKINELLVGISARMDELEKEKEVLKGFQKCGM